MHGWKATGTCHEGAFFSEFSTVRHVRRRFRFRRSWTKFRSMDWGVGITFRRSLVDGRSGQLRPDGRTVPRGALVVYKEMYGASAPNVSPKLTAEALAAGIVARETDRGG